MNDKLKTALLEFHPALQAELIAKFPELREVLAHQDRPTLQKTRCSRKRDVDFKEINSSMEIEEVGRILGLEIRKHLCYCPFHQEKTPSLRFYGDHFYCFGCGASGDSISLFSKLKGIRPIEAVKILNEIFSLGYDLERKCTYREMRKRQNTLTKSDLYREWYREAVLTLSEFIQNSYGVTSAVTLKDDCKDIGRSKVEYGEALQDILFEMVPEDAYNTYREEMVSIERKIK